MQNRTSLAVALLVFLCAISQVASGNSVDDAAELLKNERTRDKGLRRLASLARSRDDLTACRAVVWLGEYWRSSKPERLAKLVRDYAAIEPANLKYPRIEGFAEHKRLLTEREDFSQAVHALNKAAEMADAGLPTVIIREALGDCVRSRKQVKKAMAYYQDALKTGNADFKRKKVQGESESETKLEDKKLGHEHWGRVKSRIVRKIEDIQREIRIEMYGVDFVLYEDGRKAQEADDVELALANYNVLINNDEFQGSIYRAAAQYYRCFCLDKGKPGTVVQELKKFYEDQPTGLYRGDALYQIGKIHLTEFWNVDKAAKYFQSAIEFCQKTRRSDRAAALYTIPERSKSVSAAPEEYRRIDQFNIIKDVELEPGMLLNRVSSRWHLNELEKQARFGRIFTLFVDEEWEEAKQCLKPVLDLDPYLRRVHSRNRPNTYMRLELCCKHKKIILDDYELRPLPKPARLRLQYAEFLDLRRRFDEALALLNAQLKDAERRNADREIPVVLVAKIGPLSMRTDISKPGGVKKSKEDSKICEKLALRVIQNYPRSTVAAKAHLMYASCVGTRSSDTEGIKERVSHLKKAIACRPDSSIAVSCMASLVIHYLKTGEEDAARKYEKKLVERAPHYSKKIEAWKRTIAEYRKNKEEMKKK